MENYFVDICAVVIILICATVGYKKGILSGIITIVSSVISVIGAKLLTPYAAPYAGKVIAPIIEKMVVSNPEKYIEPFAKAGADILTFHYEAVNDVSAIVDLIKSFGIKAGMSIKPKTSPDEILKYLGILDLLLVMTVEPGFGGQSFMEDCAEKIPVIKRHAPENLIIQVDGGINAQTAKICTSYGANSLVAGNYIYKSDNIISAVQSLR